MKIFKRILYWFLLVVGVLLSVFADIVFLGKAFGTGLNIPVGIILCVAGFAVTVFLSIMLHELGHMIFGLIGGMAFQSIRLPFVTLTKLNGKLKFIKNNERGALGMCEMYPKTSVNPERCFALQAAGGPFGSLIALGFSLAMLLLGGSINGYVTCFFGSAAPILYLILLDNSFPLEIAGAKTDGAQIIGYVKKDPSFVLLSAALTAQGYYYSGITPKDLPYELLHELPVVQEDDLNYVYYLNNLYLYCLDKRDFEGVRDVHARILSASQYAFASVRDQLYCDLFYDCLFICPDEEFVNENKEGVFAYLETHNDLYAARIRGYYYLYKSDFVSALKEISLARELYPFYPLKGIADMEMALVDDLECLVAECSALS